MCGTGGVSEAENNAVIVRRSPRESRVLPGAQRKRAETHARACPRGCRRGALPGVQGTGHRRNPRHLTSTRSPPAFLPHAGNTSAQEGVRTDVS